MTVNFIRCAEQTESGAHQIRQTRKTAAIVRWVKALEFQRKEVRYVAAAVTSRFSAGSGASSGPLSLVNLESIPKPADGWERITTRLAGICGSDLATVDGKSAAYFEPWVSFPFVLGHEAVGTNEKGERVVLEPVLGHEARGFEPPFPGAAPADGDDYRHLVGGTIEAGIQTGGCCSTGGAWSDEFIAHNSQLHSVDNDLSDEAAVMVEPTASGVHAMLRANIAEHSTAVVIGAGTMGLVTIAAIKSHIPTCTVIAAAKYPEQQKYAHELGADIVVKPSELTRAVRRSTGSFMIGDDLSGGADVVIDAVGNDASINQAIGICRPRGRVVLLGMPGNVKVDMTALWHRETELVGAYTYGTEKLDDGSTVHSFDLAFDLVKSADLGRLVTATYPLDRYTDAITHAAQAGPRGAVKICFDFR